jgi:hypothetical protein
MKNLSTPEVQMKGAWSDQQIAGMPMMIFLGLATCVLYAGWNGSLPLGMVGRCSSTTSFCTDTVALRLSLSRTKARRYLASDYRVEVDLDYDQRGRPERRYHWRRGNRAGGC